jgi:hypothetical protein
VRWLTIVFLIGVGCAVAALGVLVAADVRLAMRPDSTAEMILRGHR